MASARPGSAARHGTCWAGRLKGIGLIFLHRAADMYSSCAFGVLHASNWPEAALAVLRHDVLPLREARELSIEMVLTGHGRAVCGTPLHPYELYPDVNELTHHRTQVRKPQINNCVERFHRTVTEESIEVAFRQIICEFDEALQADPDMWSVHGMLDVRVKATATWHGTRSRLLNCAGNLSANNPGCTCSSR